MKISELQYLRESYYDDLISAVQDILLVAIRKGVKEISTEKFMNRLARDGFVITTNQLIQAVDQSDFAERVDKDKIIPKGQISPTGSSQTAKQDSEKTVKDMAQSQARSDVISRG
jgi:hypothetical protein